MKDFKLYLEKDTCSYEATGVFELENKLFLIESNKEVVAADLVITKSGYDLKNNPFYVMIIWDKTNKSVTAKYGKFGYCHSLYYFIENNNLYIDLHLANLLNKVNFELQLSTPEVNEFVKYGFIRGYKTLLQNIYKVPSLKTMIFKNGGTELIDSYYYDNHIVNMNYVSSLQKDLVSLDKIIIPLSGGYDSTLLAYLSKDCPDKYGITVGSSKDNTNEFSTAKSTANILGLKHITVDSDYYWITKFAKIVKVLEGESYDPGTFLAYYLTETIKKNNLTGYTIISGDGADQVLNVNFYNQTMEDDMPISRHSADFYKHYPLPILYNIIIKKLEWLWRENDLKYCLPYLTNEFNSCAKNISTTNKQEYKEFVKNYLPKTISNNLAKRGGVISEKYFATSGIMTKLTKILELPKYQNLFENKSIAYQPLLYKIWVVLFEYIFIMKKDINKPFNTIINNILINN